MNLAITLTVASSPPSSTAQIAQRIADDMAHLHHRLGDAVSDELGISISCLVEQFALLATAYRSPAEREKHSLIEFNDSFTQVAVAQAMSVHGDLHRLITYQLTFPKWAHDYDETGKRTGPDKIKPVPTIHKTTLFVSPLDMVDNLPREINFAWWERECNYLGYPVGEWRRTIVGAYFNHGTNDNPNWSSHT